MKEFAEKLLKEVEAERFTFADNLGFKFSVVKISKVKEIVEQLAKEHNNDPEKSDLFSRDTLIEALNEYVAKAYDCNGIDDESVIEYQRTHNDKTSYIIQGFNEVYELLQDIPKIQKGE